MKTNEKVWIVIGLFTLMEISTKRGTTKISGVSKLMV
jgi:hypothetical protein